MHGIVDLGSDVWAIDTMMGGYGGITAGYLIRGSRPCLVETGTALSAPRVVEALQHLGIGPTDLGSIVVTHIHLDHAGGAGSLALSLPSAQIVVHERGARHLADPSRLLASARRVFGDAMDTMFGEMLPIDPARVTALGETGSVDLGDGRTLDAFYAPGHASHHVGLVDSHTGDLYTGDAAGLYIPETADVKPSTPPPDFDLEASLASLQRMRDTQPNRLLFSHFGPVDDVEAVLDRSVEELLLWVDTVRSVYSPEAELDHAIAMVQEKSRERFHKLAALTDVEHKFDVLSSTAADVGGVWRWLDQQRLADESPTA